METRKKVNIKVKMMNLKNLKKCQMKEISYHYIKEYFQINSQQLQHIGT